jgi:hypothetical protein
VALTAGRLELGSKAAQAVTNRVAPAVSPSAELLA